MAHLQRQQCRVQLPTTAHTHDAEQRTPTKNQQQQPAKPTEDWLLPAIKWQPRCGYCSSIAQKLLCRSSTSLSRMNVIESNAVPLLLMFDRTSANMNTLLSVALRWHIRLDWLPMRLLCIPFALRVPPHISAELPASLPVPCRSACQQHHPSRDAGCCIICLQTSWCSLYCVAKS